MTVCVYVCVCVTSNGNTEKSRSPELLYHSSFVCLSSCVGAADRAGYRGAAGMPRVQGQQGVGHELRGRGVRVRDRPHPDPRASERPRRPQQGTRHHRPRLRRAHRNPAIIIRIFVLSINHPKPYWFFLGKCNCWCCFNTQSPHNNHC